MPRRFIHRHQPSHGSSNWAKAALGGLTGLAVVAMLGEWTGTPMLLAPLGASAVLLFGLPDSPLSQPVNLIGGHVIATLLALILDQVLPQSGWSIALAVGLVIGVLGMLRLTHPPAGADPIVVMMLHPDWSFLFTPVLVGTVTLVLVGLLIHRIPPRSVYPLPVRVP
ncbi:HPP family protein [Magnetospirillum sp. SS-4]|uniref:HPP family protein n=1 Tax=Magnetospirillum sp. SS-4 TaxID=2681465 RepID=UPI001383D661|nr:HPP family protein [Magnetospirillum sp. SS-4]CAA7624969.1 CBS domain-containing protein [Magnetospirillum sp. SS-4]